VSGINACVYALAQEQASLGHEVSLLVTGPPDAHATRFVDRNGFRMVQLPANPFFHGSRAATLLNQEQPDIVHMHSVFIPTQAALALALRRHETPYLVTPHGGFSKHILRREQLKKALYSTLVERWRLRGAGGISVLTQAEETACRFFVPGFQGYITQIYNPIDDTLLDHARWNPKPGRPRIIYLGRFDVETKGIDIILSLAAKMLDVEFHLYGSEDIRTHNSLLALKLRHLPNVSFHKPVFGDDKARVLCEASLYLQASRWDAFAISVAEAMYIGLPCAIASTLDMAPMLQGNDLALVFDPHQADSNATILRALSDPEKLIRWSERARTFARHHFHPRTVATQFVDFYGQIISSANAAGCQRRSETVLAQPEMER